MTPTRLILLSVLGFISPILLSLGLSALLYSHQPSAQLLARTAPGVDGPDSSRRASVPDMRSEFEERTSSSISIPSRATFDPQADRDFLVSFVVSLNRLPNLGERQHMVGKYTNKIPYEGWAVGVRRLSTSLRPEVYWRGHDGSGGWLSFDEANLQTNNPYAFTVVARPGQFISLFYQPLSRDEQGRYVANGKPLFAGAHELVGVRTPQTEASLNLGIRLPQRDGPPRDFPGEISQLVISYPQKLPRKFDQMDEIISGGPATVEASLERAEINFSLSEEGRQVRSPSAVPLSFSALWG